MQTYQPRNILLMADPPPPKPALVKVSIVSEVLVASIVYLLA